MLLHKQTERSIENPEIDPRTYENLVCDKCDLSNHWEKDRLFKKWFCDRYLGTDKIESISHTIN